MVLAAVLLNPSQSKEATLPTSSFQPMVEGGQETKAGPVLEHTGLR